MECSAEANSETAPVASKVHFEFPADEKSPSVELTWYDGGLKPARPEELEEGRKLGDNGSLFVGDKGKLICSTYGNSPRLIPETKMKEYKQPPKTIPRVRGDHRRHELNWVAACKGGELAVSNFDYAGPLTEIVLLGNIAIRAREKLYWDGPNMKVTNVPEANEYVRREYRKEWSL